MLKGERVTGVFMDDFNFERESARVPGQEELKELTGAIVECHSFEQQLAELQEELKQRQKQLETVKREIIPALMNKAGMQEFTTTEGLKIIVEDKVYASIAKHNMGLAVTWLREHDLAHIIKRKLTLAFGMDELEEQDRATKLLEKESLEYDDKPYVHSSTLKKQVKDCRDHGIDIPEKIFGIHEYQEAKITGGNK